MKKLHPLLLLCAIVLVEVLVARHGLSHDNATLRVLESFPVHVTDRDEDPAARSERLTEIASAVDAASEDPTDRAALLTLIRFESGAARYVHEGRCADGPRGKHECDSGKAVGHFQLHGEQSPLLGDQALRAVQLWRGARQYCHHVVRDDLEGCFSGYATGGHCGWGGAKKRAAFMRGVRKRL